MDARLSISFPHMGEYSIVFMQLARHLFPHAHIFAAPPITEKTLELGSKYSPDFVCSPFKYNLGNYIEALDMGANVLFQTGTGCRYGYYGELQEQILRDLGYRFQFVCLSRERAKPSPIYRSLRSLGCTLSFARMLHAFYIAYESIRIMDRFAYFMRENIAFEAVPHAFDMAKNRLFFEIIHADTTKALSRAKAACDADMQNIELHKSAHALRVGMIGELYTLMEPFSNFYIEKQLANEGISVSRAMGIHFLLFGRSDKISLNNSGGYLRHAVGANGVDSVAQSLAYAKQGYDGILHIKSFGCIPELNAMPALMNISRDYHIPIMHLSFDTHMAEAGIETRIEAFADMLRMKKEGESACKY